MDPDDERELFVAAWCAHPDLVPDDMIIKIPEPEEEVDGGPSLFLRPHEIIHADLPALCYLVRIRMIEFQDWHTPPTSSDEGFDAGDEEDSNDINYNGFHPGFQASGGAGSRPRTSRFAGADERRLSRGYGPSFTARDTWQAIVVGALSCPVPSTNGAMPCRDSVSALFAKRPTHVEPDLVSQFDFIDRSASLSSIERVAPDPMLAEALLSTPPKAACDRVASARLHSIDRWPRREASCERQQGLVGTALGEDPSLLMGLWSLCR